MMSTADASAPRILLADDNDGIISPELGQFSEDGKNLLM
jgi:hypothetical protein